MGLIPLDESAAEPEGCTKSATHDPTAPVLSVVIPAFFEEGNVERLCRELVRTLNPMAIEWEVILVDDGSADRTWAEVAAVHRSDPRIKGVRLSRNFGHQHALFAGLSHTSGEAIVTMDADLQHPTSVIPQLVEEW